ncbi:Hypothetical predicted protein [Octopus vulgaris]|uniref:Uncharacterized protein n=1 Tax=Octopus vulgaris TaxID=6645 RepID=A0AA36AI05_OCTVU|nr:Hypothetical predicted protein [Octopus vulgaris]
MSHNTSKNDIGTTAKLLIEHMSLQWCVTKFSGPSLAFQKRYKTKYDKIVTDCHHNINNEAVVLNEMH